MSTGNRRRNSAPAKKQLSADLIFNDERFPKLVGLLLILFSFYLLIAFTSYLFTWQHDCDLVDRFYWGLLFEDVKMANWLGRLGAILSHQFINWLFGLPSFVFIFIFFITGVALIKGIPLKRFNRTYRYCFFTMMWSSAFLAFLFNYTGILAFPMGGAVGSAIVGWMSDFLGVIGVLAFILFTLTALVVWNKNPDFKDLNVNTLKESFIEFFKFRGFFTAARLTSRRHTEDAIDDEDEDDVIDSDFEPDSKNSKDTPLRRREGDDKATEDKTQILQKERADLEDLAKRAADLTEKQLSFELGKDNAANPQLNASLDDTELEINMGAPPEVFEDETEDVFPERSLPATGDDEAPIDYENQEPYDPTADLPSYENPVLALLEAYDDQQVVIDRAELEQNKDQIVNTLLHYKIEITKIKATIGPTVTLYEIIPAPGVRISKIKNLEDDIALSLAALGIRIIAPIPGKGTIGIEVPNRNKQVVALKEVLASERFKRSKMDLPMALGKTINNEVYVADLAKMPHLLVAGATGQGKSVGINTILMSLLYRKHPSQMKLVLIDPKKVELSPYNRLDHHYLGFLPGEEEAIITDTSKVVETLHSLTIEMDERYSLLKKANVRHISEYNVKFVGRRLSPLKGHRFLPYVILVIDEFADLIMTAGKDVELPIGRLAQLARAVGIHIIIATQRPSVNIITGVIKANFPARIGFKVTSKIDSRTILDSSGAEQLSGRGDMLISVGGELTRIQCAFVDTPEVERVIDFIADQKGYPEPWYLPVYTDENNSDANTAKVVEDLDEFFEDSARLVVIHQSGSTSMIQRRLKLGYNRAGRIMDQLEALGIVGKADGSKPREVLFPDEVDLERYLKKLREKFLK